MGFGSKSAKPPKDPDPTPQVTNSADAEVTARRLEKRRIGQNYGRQQTILAGNSGFDAAKKTILGG